MTKRKGVTSPETETPEATEQDQATGVAAPPMTILAEQGGQVVLALTEQTRPTGGGRWLRQPDGSLVRQK